MNTLFCTALVGAGATAVMDLWALARRRLFAGPLPNYGLVTHTVFGFGLYAAAAAVNFLSAMALR